ncbi:hypothetical protein LguiA_013439 [Lonicera macranthoides]
MAISLSFGRPLSSFTPMPSSQSQSSRSFFKTHNHNLPTKGSHYSSYAPLVVNCSSSEMGPSSSDHLNFRHPQYSSMTPFGVTMNEDGMSKPSFKWRRVLLKVSGEALAGDQAQNIDPKVLMAIAKEVATVARLGIEVAIVVGGGNIFRGSTWAGSSGLDRSSADYIGEELLQQENPNQVVENVNAIGNGDGTFTSNVELLNAEIKEMITLDVLGANGGPTERVRMLATVMNAIFLQATMESMGIPTRVQTAFRMSEVAEPYIRRRAIRHLEKGRVVIFAAGTGNPFFTTDTAAALRWGRKDGGSDEVGRWGVLGYGCFSGQCHKNGESSYLSGSLGMKFLAKTLGGVFSNENSLLKVRFAYGQSVPDPGHVVLKATNVDGVFDDNPRHNPNARLLDNLTYHEVISRELSVMDLTAITLCQENNIPVVVFNLGKTGNISKAIRGDRVGTLIGGTRDSAAATN